MSGAQISLLDEIVVDGFCGGGGFSTGFEFAIGAPVDIGINHDAAAIAQHRANHPHTKHYNENIFDVNPREACDGRPVGWAHFSPDCTHFSRAKGNTPVKKSIRGLAWVVKKWAGTVHPRIISMENVPEFMTWGPLVAVRDPKTGRCMKIIGTKEKTGKPITAVAAPGERVPLEAQLMRPDKAKSGKTFRQFIRDMKSLGYAVEWRVLVASDYGAPTNRRRLFILFRRDGKPIVWPEKTHGDPKSAAVKSGKLLPWHTAAECIDFDRECPSIFERKRPLAENTMKRIARGIEKFIINNPEPFIVQVNHGGDRFRGQGVDEPMPTLTAKHGFGLVTPYIMVNNDHNVPSWIDEPVRTITTGNRNFLCAPALIQYHTEQTERVRGQAVQEPLQTVDTSNRYGAVMAFLHKYYDGGYQGAGGSLNEPLPTVTATDHNSIVTANILQMNHNCVGQGMNEPLRTITAGAGHFAEVRTFLMKCYEGCIGQSVNEPLHTVTADDRFGLVTIKGTQYAIVDIGLRMLEPRELYNAQGFPPDYVIDHDDTGRKIPRYEQVAKVGNSVPPPFATALARANWPERCRVKINTMQELDAVISV